MNFEKGKVQLLLEHPFYATIFLNMELIEDKGIPTACTNGKCIKYNPDFFQPLSVGETIFVLAHEVLHIALMHHTRVGSRNPKLWNMATDYVINALLKADNMSVLKGALLNKKYDGMSSEEVYEHLKDMDGLSDETSKDWMVGEVEEGDFTNETERLEAEQEVKQLIVSAISVAKKAGKMPKGLSELLEDLVEPTVDWRAELSAFLTELFNKDYSWSVPNRRYFPMGIYLPGQIHDKTLGEVIMLVDTSGSMDLETDLKQVCGEMQGILSTFNRGFKIIYVDAQSYPVQEVEPDEDFKPNIVGRGGTSFAPGFEYIRDNDLEPCCVIYFTDSYSNDFPDFTPPYPVLWALTSNFKGFEPPFGDKVKVTVEQKSY